MTEENLAYGPSALLNSLGNSITSPLFNQQFLIKGVFRKGKGTNYNGIYYDALKDLYTDANVTLAIPATIRARLSEGQEITASVFASKRLSLQTSRIDIILNVSELLYQREKAISEKDLQTLNILQQKAALGYQDVDAIIRKRIVNQEKVKATVIIGTSAIIDKDIKQSLKDAHKAFEINFTSVNLTRPSDILQKLIEQDGCDVLIITRGGGDNIEVFNDIALCAGSLKLISPMVTAIGHAVDEPLLQKIADKNFITPTALGNYLHSIYSTVTEDLNGSKAKLISDIATQFEAQYSARIKEVNEQIQASNKLLMEEKFRNNARVTDLVKELAMTKFRIRLLIASLILVILVLALKLFLGF